MKNKDVMIFGYNLLVKALKYYFNSFFSLHESHKTMTKIKKIMENDHKFYPNNYLVKEYVEKQTPLILVRVSKIKNISKTLLILNYIFFFVFLVSLVLLCLRLLKCNSFMWFDCSILNIFTKNKLFILYSLFFSSTLSSITILYTKNYLQSIIKKNKRLNDMEVFDDNFMLTDSSPTTFVKKENNHLINFCLYTKENYFVYIDDNNIKNKPHVSLQTESFKNLRLHFLGEVKKEDRYNTDMLTRAFNNNILILGSTGSYRNSYATIAGQTIVENYLLNNENSYCIIVRPNKTNTWQNIKTKETILFNEINYKTSLEKIYKKMDFLVNEHEKRKKSKTKHEDILFVIDEFEHFIKFLDSSESNEFCKKINYLLKELSFNNLSISIIIISGYDSFLKLYVQDKQNNFSNFMQTKLLFKRITNDSHYNKNLMGFSKNLEFSNYCVSFDTKIDDIKKIDCSLCLNTFLNQRAENL